MGRAERVLADKQQMPKALEDEQAASVLEPALAAPARSGPVTGTLVGASHDNAEGAADRAAATAIARMRAADHPARGDHSHDDAGHSPAVPVRRLAAGHGAIGAEGGTLDADSDRLLSQHSGRGARLDTPVLRRLESGFGTSLSHVRVHRGAIAEQLSATMGALAFTRGSDVFFGAGQYAPDTDEGMHTLAHEVAHTLQPSGSVHRKLAGTAMAAQSMGGAGTSGRLRKAVGLGKNWDKILGGLRDYEGLEAAVMGKLGKAREKEFEKRRKAMRSKLVTVSKLVDSWEAANSKQSAKGPQTDSRFDYEPERAFDQRSKAERRQVIAMLRPRLANELSLVNAGATQWLSAVTLAPSSETSRGRSAAGMKNTVTESTWETPEGPQFTGFFKADKGMSTDVEPQEIAVGITWEDPNFGARAVAMYRLDQLFNAGVTARAEFAVQTLVAADGTAKSHLGTVLESAQGAGASDYHVRHDGGGRGQDAQGKETISLDDPVLQSSLNKLQLLDAVCGQLDRHQGNYLIQTDGAGGVTGITGIDLDMAFGSKMDHVISGIEAMWARDDGTPHGPIAAQRAQNYRGLPPYVDRDFGEALLGIPSQLVADALKGLLSDEEIAATVTRFGLVQDHIRAEQQAGKLVDTWDGTLTRPLVRDRKPTDAQFNNRVVASENRSYSDDLEKFSLQGLIARVQGTVDRLLASDRVLDMLLESRRKPGNRSSDAYVVFRRGVAKGLAGEGVTEGIAAALYNTKRNGAHETLTSQLAQQFLWWFVTPERVSEWVRVFIDGDRDVEGLTRTVAAEAKAFAGTRLKAYTEEMLRAGRA